MLKATEAEILAGGCYVGTRFVRLVPMRDIEKLGQAWMNEPEEVKLYAGLNESDLEAVEEDAWDAIIKEGRRLNFTRFDRWRARRVVVGEAILAAQQEASQPASSSSSAKVIESPTS